MQFVGIRDNPVGRRGWRYLPKLSYFSLFQAQGEVVLHRIYRKNIPKDYHFSSELQKKVKTSPCFKFLGLPLGICHCSCDSCHQLLNLIIIFSAYKLLRDNKKLLNNIFGGSKLYDMKVKNWQKSQHKI